MTLTEITIPHDEADSEVPRVLRSPAGPHCWPAGVPGPAREHHREGGRGGEAGLCRQQQARHPPVDQG